MAIDYSRTTELFVGSNPADCGVRLAEGENFFPTIERALDCVRKMREDGFGQPVSVKLTEQVYFLDHTLTIDEGISRIVIEPLRDRTSLIGGRRISDFAPDTYNGTACLSAVIPEECLNEKGEASFTDLYVNGRRAALTRYPSEGYLYPVEVEDNQGQLSTGSRWFIANEGDIRSFRNIDRVQISFCHYWIDEHTPIKEYDPETRRVTFRYKSRFNISGGKGSSSGLEYYLENVAEAFANPGEWYADGNKVYYIPEDGMSAEDITVFAPVISKFIDVHGTPAKKAENIRFRGLDFSVSKGDYGSLDDGNVQSGNCSDDLKFASDGQAVFGADGNITFKYAAGCSVEDCTLKNFGLHGFVIDLGCHNIRIASCDIYDGGAGGVKIIGGAVGCPREDETYGNTVTNCSILYCGRRYFAACGVLMIHTYENVISHNDIGHLYYTGVSVGWVWGYKPNITRDNLITKNHIHHLGGGMLSDMGGVYLLGLQPGTVVSNNVIHDVKSKNYGGWALYTDEGSSYITLENNICYNTSDNSYHQHYGSMNTVRNNIFAFSDGQMMRVSRTEPHVSIIFERNIIYSDGVPMYDLSREHISEGRIGASRNLYYDRSRSEPVMRDFGEEKYTLADMRAAGMEEGSAIADPRFVDADNYDFTLCEDSPAFALGFKRIDVSDVGILPR